MLERQSRATKRIDPGQADDDQQATRGPPLSARIAVDRYVPGLIRAVANKLEGGASRFYRRHYAIGLSEWHILVALATDPWMTSPVLCKAAGLDKAAVSRSLGRMEQQGLIVSRDTTGRCRATALTAKGRRLHDKIAQAALTREEELLSDFSPKQVEALVALLTQLGKSASGLTDAFAKPARRMKAVASNGSAASYGANGAPRP
ncbi:MarR family winged helix-turn-helix transcriptional regulator [Acidisoma cladoniae]|jgi:DNA-binding MarR family transcriptional regulator|uniref:MarR family winged helix-turn-helix transcriptional regulator n=1 Tax=Acidisoma cladoniae TaxID=3040935 RepID=UPI002550CD78|nr:MarR family transcriptional regulator [Acidisoma sp. PAMC 29798]